MSIAATLDHPSTPRTGESVNPLDDEYWRDHEAARAEFTAQLPELVQQDLAAFYGKSVREKPITTSSKLVASKKHHHKFRCRPVWLRLLAYAARTGTPIQVKLTVPEHVALMERGILPQDAANRKYTRAQRKQCLAVKRGEFITPSGTIVPLSKRKPICLTSAVRLEHANA